MEKRKCHPYFMYDGIKNTKLFLKECLSKEITSSIDNVCESVLKRNVKRIIFVGCGTSSMIANASRQFFAELTNFEVISGNAFELMNYPYFKLSKNDAVFGFSHTGGTKAVVDYIKMVRGLGIMTVGICEKENSRLAEASELSIIGPGGIDKATPKTRSLQTGLYISLMIAKKLGDAQSVKNDIDLGGIPDLVGKIFDIIEPQVIDLLERWGVSEHYLVAGSGINSITAKEGGLKILESAATPSFGLEMEEVAHGNELMLNDNFSTFIINYVPSNSNERFRTIASGTRETGSKVCVISNKGIYDSNLYDSIVIPLNFPELVSIMIFVVPLQLFAYYLTLKKNLDPDSPQESSEKMLSAINKYSPPGFH